MKKLIRTLRQMLIVFVAAVNILSSIIGALIWSLVLSRGPAIPQAHAPFVPLITAVLIAIPLSTLASKPTTKPLRDLIEATKAISKVTIRSASARRVTARSWSCCAASTKSYSIAPPAWWS